MQNRQICQDSVSGLQGAQVVTSTLRGNGSEYKMLLAWSESYQALQQKVIDGVESSICQRRLDGTTLCGSDELSPHLQVISNY
ncbi:MAG: hypothetical protein ACLSGB_13805 [Dorea sp.]